MHHLKEELFIGVLLELDYNSTLPWTLDENISGPELLNALAAIPCLDMRMPH